MPEGFQQCHAGIIAAVQPRSEALLPAPPLCLNLCLLAQVCLHVCTPAHSQRAGHGEGPGAGVCLEGVLSAFCAGPRRRHPVDKDVSTN